MIVESKKQSFPGVTTHGMSETKIYKLWIGMIQRCHNPKSRSFKDYGAKGVVVCDRWLHSFQNFYEDMGEKPEGYSLDRIDCKGNYEPSNCRWADLTTQVFNQATRTDNTSGVSGVYWSKRMNKWHAQITFKNKKIHLGFFTNKEDAVEARKKAELTYFGFNK